METYTIKELSQMFDIPASTLRYYEEIGILTNVERTSTGQRIYYKCHVNRLGATFCFKRTGMTISQIQEFFQYEEHIDDNIEDILALLNQHKLQITEQIQRMQEDLVHINKKVNFYSDIKTAIENNAPYPDWKSYGNTTR